MASNVQRIAAILGASVVESLPETGGGAFGAARLAAIVNQLQSHAKPNVQAATEWEKRSEIPMSAATAEKLERLASRASTNDRTISPVEFAAQLLEDVVAKLEA